MRNMNLSEIENGSNWTHQRGELGFSARKNRVPLPNEILQQIIQSDALTTKDILQFRGVCKQWKEAIDYAIIPNFRVPTTSVAGEGLGSKNSAPAFLNAKFQSYARKISGQSSQRLLTIGTSSLLIREQIQDLLVRCGNGRLLRADLSSSSCIFSEIAKGGSIVNGEELLAANHQPGTQRLWNILTQSSSNNDIFLYHLGPNGQWRTLMPKPFIVPTQRLDRIGPGNYTFSDCGQYLVERFFGSFARYHLDYGNRAIHIDATLQVSNEGVTLCAQTGRRFQFDGSDQTTVTIFSNSLSTRVEKKFNLRKHVMESWKGFFSVSPDGRRVSVQHGYTGPCFPFTSSMSQWYSFDTYEIPDKSFGSLSPISSQKIELHRNQFRLLEPSWQIANEGKLVFRHRGAVRTADYGLDLGSRVGLESPQRMTALFLPTPNSDFLYFLSNLPLTEDDSDQIMIPKEKKIRYLIDEFVLRVRPEEAVDDTALGIALSIFALSVGSFLNNQKNSLWLAGVMATSAFASVFYATIHLRQAQISQKSAERWNAQEALASIDLQTTSLPSSK